MRFAMQALLDNPLTRGWSNAVTDWVINPVERLAVGDAGVARDTEMQLARAIDADLHRNKGALSQPMRDLLVEHLGDVDVERFGQARNAFVNEGWWGNPDREVDRLASITAVLRQGPYAPGVAPLAGEGGGGDGSGGVDPRKTAALRNAVLRGNWSRAYTEPGELVRQYVLGSPAAAYGATAAAGVGAWQGGQALAQWWQSRQAAEEGAEEPEVSLVAE